MNENINLCEILKDCPKGTKLYSYNYGDVEFWGISQGTICPIMIRVRTTWRCSFIVFLTKEGFTSDDYSNLICTLVPSKDQQDWSKWQCPKPKFDPKTLKPFDRVLAKSIIGSWACDNFSHIDCNGNFICIGHSFVRAIPYNDDTKHLVGTTDEAPEYYRYWED